MQAIIVFANDSVLNLVPSATEIVYPAYNGNKLHITFDDKRLSIANYGDGILGPNPGKHVLFKSVTVKLQPGLSVYASPYLKPGQNQDEWVLVDLSTKPASSTRIVDTDKYHCFSGGEIWDWRFVPAGREYDPPFKERWTSDPSCLEKLVKLIPKSEVADDPRYKSLLKGMTMDLTTLGNLPIKDLYGWMDPATFKKRWASIPLDSLSGPYHWGDVFAPGEGHTNSHYNLFGWCFMNAIVNGDYMAAALGAFGIHKKIQFGLYHYDPVKSARTPTWIDGIWRGEKSAVGGLRGDTVGPAPAKQFDLELVIAWLLYDDPLIDKAFKARAQQVLRSPVTWWWNGAGGERMAARHFESTWAFWIATGDPAFKARAELMFTHMFNKFDTGNPTPRGPFWTSIYTSEKNFIRPWEGAKLLTAMSRWMLGGDCGRSHEAAFNSALDFYWNKCVRPHPTIPGAWETSYRYDVSTDAFNPAPYNIGNPVHNVFWIGMLRVLRARTFNLSKIEGIKETVLNGILRLWNEVAVKPTPPPYVFSPGGIGAAADKINGINLYMGWGV